MFPVTNIKSFLNKAIITPGVDYILGKDDKKKKVDPEYIDLSPMMNQYQRGLNIPDSPVPQMTEEEKAAHLKLLMKHGLQDGKTPVEFNPSDPDSPFYLKGGKKIKFK